ncbi:zinc finger, CCHC-type containing protein [Tanacetum coccineum]
MDFNDLHFEHSKIPLFGLRWKISVIASDIDGDDTDLPPQNNGIFECSNPQPKQVTKNDVKSRPEPQDPAHNMKYTTASAAFIYASQLAVMGLKKTDKLFEDNNLLNLQGWWQMEKIGDLWRVWTDDFGNRLVDVLLLSESVKDGSVRHFPSLENHFWANHCKEGKGFIPVVSEQKGSSNTTIHVSIITQESTMDIKKKKEKRQIQEEKERRKAERADLVSEQKGSSNTTIHVSIITQESTMDIKKKKEKRQIQEEKERRKAERADLVSEQKGSSNTTIHVSIITQESTMDIKKKKEKRQIQEEKERRKAERADNGNYANENNLAKSDSQGSLIDEPSLIEAVKKVNVVIWSRRVSFVWATRFAITNFLAFKFFDIKERQGIDRKGFLEFFDCPSSRQGVEDLREVKHRKARWEYCTKAWRFKVGFKQLGPGVETGIHEVHDEKRVSFEVELQGAHGDREAEVFQVSNDDTAVAQRWLEDKQPKEKTNTDCLVYTTMYEEWGRQTFGCYRDTVAEWAEDTTRSTYLVNRSPSSVIRFKKHIDMLEFFGWLASIKQGMLEPVKVKCIFLGYHESIVGDKLWRLDDVTSKVVLYRNMGFNESEEYKKTFIGYGVDTGSVHVLQGVEFEVEPQEDHTFEVEPHVNVDHVAGSHETQTQDLMDYHSARDREQHSSRELFGYREDSNEAAFAVAAVEKIYAHESLTFNDIVASTVAGKAVTTETTITGNIHQAEIWVTKGLLDKAKGNVLGIEIIRDQSGNTLRVSQSSLSRDCDVEKNGKWSYTYAVESQVYQGVCTRPDIASADVGVELNRVAVNCDNQGAIHLSRNHVFHERNKHINVRYHFIREVLEAKAVKVLKVGTEHNAADALTKVVPGHKLQHCLELLSVVTMVVGDQIPTSGIRAQGIDSKGFLEFFDCPGSRQGVEDLREGYIDKQGCLQHVTLARSCKHRKARWEYCTKGMEFKVGFKPTGLGVEKGIHEVHDENVFRLRWNAGAHRDVKLRFLWVTQQCMKSGVAKHLGVTRITVAEWVGDEINVTLFAKVSLFFDSVWSVQAFLAEMTYFKVELYKELGFNEVRNTEISLVMGWFTGNTNQDLMDYHEVHVNREQHSSRELFGIEKRNGCSVDEYVSSNVAGKKLVTTETTINGKYTPLDKAKEVLGIEDHQDSDGNTLRVSQSRCGGMYDIYQGLEEEAIWLGDTLEERGISTSMCASFLDSLGCKGG